MNTSPTQPHNYDDEIDLIELVQDLWQEKLIVIVLTFVVFAAAGVYAFTAKPTPIYSSSLNISLAKIGGFGDYVAKMGEVDTSPLVVASETSRQFLDVLADSLQANRNSGITSYKGSLAIVKNYSAVNRTFIESVRLTLTSTNPQNLQEDLINYLEAVSQETLQELNNFAKNLGANQQVTAVMLHGPITKPNKPTIINKPKTKLILAVGLVAGGMLGVFAALIRSMLRKRAKQLAQQAA